MDSHNGRPVALPGHFYLSSEVFAQELRAIFSRTWQLVGREEDLAKPGDFLTTVLGVEPLLVIRGKDGVLRALHNVCPHRGARLLSGNGSCSGSVIKCPYHSWTFSAEGRLLSVPQAKQLFPDLDTDSIQLHPAQVDTWRGFVFVNPDPGPGGVGLREYLADFPPFLDDYSERYEELREMVRFTFEEPVNWKVLVENYVEDYHFATAHPETLKVFDFTHVRTLPTGPHSRVYLPYRKEPPPGDCKYPWESSGGSYQGYVFPNMMINTAKNHVSVFQVIPLGPERTRIEIPIFQTGSQQEQYPLDFKVLKEDVQRDMEEDFVICRLLQAGMGSRAYQVSALAREHELGVAHFHEVWRQYVQPEEAKR